MLGTSTSSVTALLLLSLLKKLDKLRDRILSPKRLNEFQCKPSAEANLFGYAKAQPEIMKSEALNNNQHI